jgi:LmbE family N-acetylglucosaminyl deacetylase
MAGGLLAAAAANGQRVAVFTATRGEAGVQDELRWPRTTLGDTRTGELRAALRELDVKRSYIFDYPDGGCARVPAASPVAAIARVIAACQPDTVLTFGGDGMTGHPDHCTVSAWTTQAVRQAGSHARILHAVLDPQDYTQYIRPIDARINLFFNIDTPPCRPAGDCAVAYRLPPDFMACKMRALQAMPSQTARLFSMAGYDAVARAFMNEYFVGAGDEDG